MLPNAFANSRYVIPVAAIDHKGKQAWYSEPGASVLVSAPSSSAYLDGTSVGITTTDIAGDRGYDKGDYTHSFGGTSAAAPIVSAVVAMMLQANSNLSWRDVQQILVETSRRNDREDSDWVKNGAGKWVNYKYGFGSIDATKAVEAAKNWQSLAPEVAITSGELNVGVPILDNDPNGIEKLVEIADDISVEKIEVMFDAAHPYRGDLKVVLISPDGTESVLAEPRFEDEDNYQKWVFTSARHWGESSVGKWKLQVIDKMGRDVGTWNGWKLNLYGTANPATVSIQASDPNATEDGNAGQFVVKREGGVISKPLTVNYAIAGNATNGSDYKELTGTVTIPAGATAATIPVVPIHDYEVEGNETVIVSLTDADGYDLDANSSATATLTNSTTTSWYGPFVYVNPANGHQYILSQVDTWLGAQEQAQALGGNLVSINNAAEKDWLLNTFGYIPSYWIGLTDSSIYGKKEGDFGWVNKDPVTYTNWHPSEPSNQLHTPEGEDFVNINHHNEVYLGQGKWNDLPHDFASLSGIIEIDPTKLTQPIVNVMVTDAEAGENGNAGQIIFTRVGNLSQDLTVNYSVAGNATNGTDYQTLSGTIAIPAGESLVTIPIIPLSDNNIEGNETVVVNVAPGNYEIGDNRIKEVAIADESPINRLYRELFGRDGDVQGVINWTNIWQSGASLSSVRWNMAHEPQQESVMRINQIYQDLQGRAATSEEISYWKDRLGTDTTLSQVRQEVEGGEPIDTTNFVYTNPDTGHKYFFTAPDTWLGAQEQAKTLGGNLVTVNDAGETNWLNNTFSTGAKWIGFTDSPIYGATEGNYKWVSEEPVNYNYWHRDEPSNTLITPEGEDFVEFIGAGWNDLPQAQNWIQQGIVEIPSKHTATNLNSTQTYTEDITLDSTDIVVTDPDGQATVTLKLNNPVAGILTTGLSGALTSTYNPATGEWTASGAVADVNALLADVKFTPANNFNGDLTIETKVTDDIAAPLTGTINLKGTPVNDAPNFDTAWTYFGEDLNFVGESVRIPTPNANNVRDTFFANLTNIQTEDFENLVPGVIPQTLTFGSETATLSGIPRIRELATGTFNGTFPLSGDKYLFSNDLSSGKFKIDFNDPQSAFGLFSTDYGDLGGKLILTLHQEDGSTTDILVPHTVPSQPGSALYFGVIDSNTSFTGVTLSTTIPQDGFGFDDFTIGQVKPDAIAPSAPAVSPTITQTYIEDTPLNLTNLSIKDADIGDTVTVTLTLSNVNAGILTTDTINGRASTFDGDVWSASGSVADVNALLANVQFIPTENFNGDVTVTASVTDNVAPAVTSTINLTGTPVNDAPTVEIEPTRIWTRQLGSTGYDIANDVAVDSAGNVYFTGWVRGALDGNVYAGGSGLPGASGDGFLMRYNAEGDRQWTSTLGSAADDAFNGVAVDSAGNAYVVGSTSGALDGHANLGLVDGFFAKYDANGNIVWSRQIGTTDNDELRHVVTDGAGNIYTVGYTNGLLDGSSSGNGSDALLIKWDSNGNILWKKQFNNAGHSIAAAVDFDPTTGSIYIAGHGLGTVDGQPNAGGLDAFVVRYDSNGNLIWTRQLRTSADERISDLDIDSNGNIHVAGSTKGTLLGNTSAWGQDAFAAKYDNSGNLLWNRQFGTAGEDNAAGVGVDSNGNVFITGAFEESPGAGSWDAFLTGFDSNGDRFSWTQQFSTPGWDGQGKMTFDPNGNFYAAGWAQGAIDGQPYAGSVDPLVMKYALTQTYTENTAIALKDIVIRDKDPENTVTATLTLSDVNAGILTTGTFKDTVSTFNNGVWSASGALADVNALLANVQFIPAENFNGEVTVTTSVTDNHSLAVTNTITLKVLG